MLKRVILLAAFTFIASAFAHPGIGIVMDGRGNVFFTDLKQVWKISPQGNKSVAVPNVHTHELCLDAEDNLYGEHLWYEGEAIDKWGHYVWKLRAEGKLEQVIPRREGFLQNYSFVRDRSGNMYWAERGDTTIIRKRAVEGAISDMCRTHDFRDVRWMTVSAEGTVYLIDDGDLRCVRPSGEVRTLARALKERRFFEFIFGDSHNLMGLWLDAAGNVYVAVTGGRLVKKISPKGEIKVVARSTAPWSPTGGLLAPNGDLWLLEYSDFNTTRVRLIQPSGQEKFYGID
jgi:hypothetical protein